MVIKCEITIFLLVSQKGKLQSDLDDTSAKLKKTISERDLLIREFKTLKASSAKTEVNLKKMNDDQLKAAKKLLDQVTALENTVQTASKGDKEKDKIIKVQESCYICCISKGHTDSFPANIYLFKVCNRNIS